MLWEPLIYSQSVWNVTEPGLDCVTEEPSGTRRSWRTGGLFNAGRLRGECLQRSEPRAQTKGAIYTLLLPHTWHFGRMREAGQGEEPGLVCSGSRAGRRTGKSPPARTGTLSLARLAILGQRFSLSETQVTTWTCDQCLKGWGAAVVRDWDLYMWNWMQYPGR